MPLLIVNYVFTLLVAKLPILSLEKQPSPNSYASLCNICNNSSLPFSSRLGPLRWLRNFWHTTKLLQQNAQKILLVLMGVIV